MNYYFTEFKKKITKAVYELNGDNDVPNMIAQIMGEVMVDKCKPGELKGVSDNFNMPIMEKLKLLSDKLTNSNTQMNKQIKKNQKEINAYDNAIVKLENNHAYSELNKNG